jgi:acetyl-CoA carboxylase biotin carboxyl carrier protein
VNVGLTDDDVREVLRIIDESGLAELKLETPGFVLHVCRDGAQPVHGEAPARAHADAPAPPPGSVVPAPMLGTFYRAEGPGQPPFVDVGSRVEADTVVCLIEVMKLMNHIQAGVTGTVAEVLARNDELVEYGQPLFRVTPDP